MPLTFNLAQKRKDVGPRITEIGLCMNVPRASSKYRTFTFYPLPLKLNGWPHSSALSNVLIPLGSSRTSPTELIRFRMLSLCRLDMRLNAPGWWSCHVCSAWSSSGSLLFLPHDIPHFFFGRVAGASTNQQSCWHYTLCFREKP